MVLIRFPGIPVPRDQTLILTSFHWSVFTQQGALRVRASDAHTHTHTHWDSLEINILHVLCCDDCWSWTHKAVHNSTPTKSSSEEPPRRPVQAVISSREIGSMDRKSTGRGRRGPTWEVQSKQSPFFNHPSSRSELEALWCSPSAPPPPSRPSLPNGRTEGQTGKHADSAL